jgi:hypothetical protein
MYAVSETSNFVGKTTKAPKFREEKQYSSLPLLSKNHSIAHLLILHRFGVSTISTLVEFAIVLVHVRAALALGYIHDKNAAFVIHSYRLWSESNIGSHLLYRLPKVVSILITGVAPSQWTVTDYATNPSRVHLLSYASGDK